MNGSNEQQQNPRTGDLSLLDVLVAFAKHKHFFLLVPGVLAVVTLIVVLLIPKTYTATTTVMPPQQNQSNALVLLGQVSGLGGLAQGALGLKNPSDIFASILRSRTVSDAIIAKFDLKNVYNEEYMVDAREELREQVNVVVAKDGVISVDVDDADPNRAAEMANAYIAELQVLTQKLAVGEAGQRRLFFEQQVAIAKHALNKSEADLRKFQEESGLVVPQGQAQLTVTASAGLQAQIAAREVQISSMRAFATKDNPELVRLEKEVSGLKEQLARLEKITAGPPGGVLVPLGGASKSGLQYIQLLRQVKYSETLFESLAKQYEVAKIDEANNATLIQVVDRAIPPEKESRPRKGLAIGIALLVGIVIAIAMALMRESVVAMGEDPTQASKIKALYTYLRSR